MAEVSDFDVASPQRFLTGSRPLDVTFYSGGRNANRRAILQFAAFGGYNPDASGDLRIRVRLNGTLLGSFSVPRWASHLSIIPETVLTDFSSNLLRSSGANALRFEPVYTGSTDYCWLGPAIVMFRQNS